MNSDSKIWEDFKRGENYALSHIYYQYIQLLFRYGKKFSDDDEIVKDAIQDLFFDLIRTREKLGKTDNIKFYLLASFRHKIIKTLKKQAFVIGTPDDKMFDAEIIYSAENDIIDKEELSQKEKAIQEALKKLTAKQREILFYRFSCDLEYEQICEIMSLKYDSARKQVFRALKSLKEVLSDRDIFILFLSLFPRKN